MDLQTGLLPFEFGFIQRGLRNDPLVQTRQPLCTTSVVFGDHSGRLQFQLDQLNLRQELAAREIKKAVVGTGSANKQQVQRMVAELLGLEARPASDAADALAGAICAANQGRLAELGVSARRRRRTTRRASSRLVARALR